VAAQTKIAVEELEALRAEMLELVFKGAAPDPSTLEVDKTALHQAQRDAVSANMAWAFLAALAVLIACLVVANATQRIWPAVMMGAFGWLVSAYSVAAILRYTAALYAGLTAEYVAELPYPSLATGPLPFAFMFLTGLSTTFLWQTAIPCALGTFVGLRLRIWRLSSDFVGPYYESVSDEGSDSATGVGVPPPAASASATGEGSR